ncbi:hypothetical protein [Novosphingobium sp. M1R2S20]|uniref:Uncharacterized protein n=1 Tax=Novosphingobium rhizovicinum TaxID=3228928 RepID=A0ABV3RDL9_9SPHN
MILARLIALPGWLKAALAGVLGVVIVTGVILWLNAREEADDKANQQIGATQQREGDLRETITRVETANEARVEIADPDSRARYDQCVRSARTPENCLRLLPERQADQR